MSNILTLAKQFINLGITGSITPAGALMAVALLLGTADSTSESPLRTLLYRFSAYTEINRQRVELEQDRCLAARRLRHAQERVQVTARSQQSAQAALDNAIELRNHVRGVYLDRWQRRHGLREEAKGRLGEYQGAVNRNDGKLTEATRRAAQATADEAMHLARVESLNADIDSLQDERLALAPIAFGRLFSTLLSIYVLGWLIGIVLNPVNKLLLTPFRRTAPEPYKDPLYLIGKNVITQEDYDYLVRNYHRFAQVAASLVLPVLALGFVLYRWSESSHGYCWSPVIAILIALALLCLARHRYGEFRDRVTEFVNGRLCFMEMQRKEAESREQKNNLVALAKAITEASRLLKLAKSCCCPKCKPKPDSCNALGDVITEVEKLLERAQSCFTSECKSALDSCGEALSQAVDKARSRLKDAQSRGCPECKSKLDCCNAALDEVDTEASRLLKLAKSCCCSKSPPPPDAADARNAAASADAGKPADAGAADSTDH